MSEISTEEIKSILLDALSWFDGFAKENGLRYCLHGGTLLGAMRHDGFIPWDDDIDIAMLREDYDRLIDIMRTHHGRYQLIAPESNPRYLYPFAKLVDTKTELTENTLDCGVPLGISIDIFPLDRDTDDMDLRLENKKKIDFCATMISFVMGRGKHTSTGIKRIAAFGLDLFFAIAGKRFATNCMLKTLKKIYCRQEYDTYVTTFTPNYALKQMLRREWMNNLTTHKFENLELPVYCQADAFLTQLYGDWHQLPPIEQQIPHHDFVAHWK